MRPGAPGLWEVSSGCGLRTETAQADSTLSPTCKHGPEGSGLPGLQGFLLQRKLLRETRGKWGRKQGSGEGWSGLRGPQPQQDFLIFNALFSALSASLRPVPQQRLLAPPSSHHGHGRSSPHCSRAALSSVPANRHAWLSTLTD